MSMEDFEDYDLDASMQRTLLPWKLRLTIGGKKFLTRCPTIGQIGALSALAGRRDEAAGNERMEIARQLFADPSGAMNAMIPQAFPKAIQKILEYAREYAAKNSQAAGPQAPAAKAADSTAGNSSPQS